jgi:phage gpG-like protein
VGDASLTADLQQLDRLQAAIRRIKSTEFLLELSRDIADYMIDQVHQEFLVSRDPYGQPWAPLKRPRAGLGGPLLKTARLQNSIRARVSRKGVTLYSNRYYSSFQQTGTRNMPARKYLPDQLPDEWRAELERLAEDAVQRALARVI